MSKAEFEKRIRENLGETVHVAFRKGPLKTSGRTAAKVHALITKMPPAEWDEVLNWMAWCMAQMVDLDGEKGTPDE